MTIFTYDHEFYDTMLANIHVAKDRIFFKWFIIKVDETGTEFRNALIEAARRGVDTYVIIDTRGNVNQDPRFRHLPEMEHLHTLLFPFVRPGLFNGCVRGKGCDHRKILTVDKRIGYVGGYNIGTLYVHEWRDTHMRIEGPAAWELDDAFIDMWNDYRKKYHPAIADDSATDWDATVCAAMSTPALDVFPISTLYMDAINHSVVRAWMTTDYFIPEESMLAAMADVACRGADVRVPIPEYSNYTVGDWTGRPHYEHPLRSGVRTFLYEEVMVHSKTMTADGRWPTVGMVDIDRLSLRDNFEINVEVFDPGFAAAMECISEVDLANPRELTLEQ